MLDVYTNVYRFQRSACISYENLRKFYFTKQRRTRLGLGLREVCAMAPCLIRPFLPRLLRAGRRRYVPMRKSLSAGSRISFFHFHIPSCAHILVRYNHLTWPGGPQAAAASFSHAGGGRQCCYMHFSIDS